MNEHPRLRSYTGPDEGLRPDAYRPQVGDLVRVRYNPVTDGRMEALSLLIGKVVRVHDDAEGEDEAAAQVIDVELRTETGEAYVMEQIPRKRQGVDYPAWRPHRQGGRRA